MTSIETPRIDLPALIDKQEAAEVAHRIEELGYQFPAFSLQRRLCFAAARDFNEKYMAGGEGEG